MLQRKSQTWGLSISSPRALKRKRILQVQECVQVQETALRAWKAVSVVSGRPVGHIHSLFCLKTQSNIHLNNLCVLLAQSLIASEGGEGVVDGGGGRSKPLMPPGPDGGTTKVDHQRTHLT